MQATTTLARGTAVPWNCQALLTALTAGLDRCAHGMALVDSEGRPWFANATARRLLQSLAGDQDSQAHPARGPHLWYGALGKVCRLGRCEFVDLQMTKGQLSVALMPVQVQDLRLAFALFGREELCGPVELQLFALRHQLTVAETQVLGLLCKGLAANDIALVNGVARTTVLTQIAAIRAKTGSASIRALLSLLSRMPQLAPWLGVH